MHCGFHAFHGFLAMIGTIALLKLLVRGFWRGRHYRRFGGGGCGPRGFGGGGPWGHHHHGPWGHHRHGWNDGEDYGDDERDFGSRRGGWGRRKLGFLFQNLETTPEQERVLFETFGQLKDAGRKIAGKVADSRSQWADALEADSFDETMVGGAVADLEHAVDDARKSAIDAFAKVHATLDAPQRKRLASFLRKRGFGPYRSVL